jgi:hypothetical protein
LEKKSVSSPVRRQLFTIPEQWIDRQQKIRCRHAALTRVSRFHPLCFALTGPTGVSIVGCEEGARERNKP